MYRSRASSSTTLALTPPASHEKVAHQLFRNSTPLGCRSQSTGVFLGVDSIRSGRAFDGAAAAPCTAQSARPPSAFGDEVVVQFQQLLGLQSDALQRAFEGQAGRGRAAAHREALGAGESGG